MLRLFDGLAVSVLSEGLSVISTIIDGLRIYQALEGGFTAVDSRAALFFYFQSRCGEAPNCSGGQAKETVWQTMTEDFANILDLMSRRTGVEIGLLQNWFENAFAAHRLVAYGDSARVRQEVGFAIARLASGGR